MTTQHKIKIKGLIYKYPTGQHVSAQQALVFAFNEIFPYVNMNSWLWVCSQSSYQCFNLCISCYLPTPCCHASIKQIQTVTEGQFCCLLVVFVDLLCFIRLYLLLGLYLYIFLLNKSFISGSLTLCEPLKKINSEAASENCMCMLCLLLYSV